MAGAAQREVGLAQGAALVPGQPARARQRFEDAHVVRPLGQRGLLSGAVEDGVLDHKFQVHDAARPLLEVEVRGFAARAEVIAHFFTHTGHRCRQPPRVPLAAQHFAAQRRHAPRQGAVAGERPRAHQRLVFPGPGLLALVVRESAEARYRQTRGARGAQAHIHLIQLPEAHAGIEDVDHALHQAGVEGGVIHGPGATRQALGRSVVDKGQIEVRGVTQLNAAELAAGQHHKTAACVRAARRAVARLQLRPGQRQHLFETDFGNKRQLVAHFHQGQTRGDVGSGDAQHLGGLEVAQRLHMPFEIIHRQARQCAAQRRAQRIALGRAVQAVAIEQLIEQRRVTRQLLGNPGAGGAQQGEIGERRRIFDQQQQIGAAPRHGDDQRQRALQRQVRVLAAGAGVQQQRHKAIQALPTRRLKTPHAPRMEQLLNPLGLRLGPREAERFELSRVALSAPQRGRGAARRGGGDQAGEVPRHPLAVRLQGPGKVRVAAKTHGLRERGPGQRIGGQLLGLAIFPGLNRMLRVAQKTIGLAKFHGDRPRQATQRRALGQYRQQFAPLQGQLAAAADQLKTLGDKLDFANAAAAQLDVALQTAPAHFSHDTPLHVAQTVDGAVIHVAAVDKRAQKRL